MTKKEAEGLLIELAADLVRFNPKQSIRNVFAVKQMAERRMEYRFADAFAKLGYEDEAYKVARTINEDEGVPHHKRGEPFDEE